MQKVVLVDVDGTLLDSNDAHASAWVEALREAGHRATFEKVRPLIGKGGDNLLAEVAGLSEDSSEGAAIGDRRARIFRDKYLPSVKPFPCVRDVLQRLHRDGYRLVVATSAQEDEMTHFSSGPVEQSFLNRRPRRPTPSIRSLIPIS